MEANRVLAVAAHPDDEILGCGGTLARLSNEGAEVYTLILGEGKTSRARSVIYNSLEKEKQDLKQESVKANKIIGVRNVIFKDFPDNRFDSIDLIDIVKSIEELKKEIKPNIIFTHYYNDLNIDHRITYNAVITATRPMEYESVNIIYSFEVLSSTEWNYPITFSPNVFFNITSTMNKKLKAMEAYSSELREYPHPRSLEALVENAKTWAYKSGINGHAEAFHLIRGIL